MAAYSSQAGAKYAERSLAQQKSLAEELSVVDTKLFCVLPLQGPSFRGVSMTGRSIAMVITAQVKQVAASMEAKLPSGIPRIWAAQAVLPLSLGQLIRQRDTGKMLLLARLLKRQFKRDAFVRRDIEEGNGEIDTD